MSSNEKFSNFLGDRKEEVVTTPFSDKKSLTKDVDKGTDEFADTLLMEKKSSTKNVEKGTGELADTLLMGKKSSTKNVEKGTDEFSDTLFMETKYPTKDVDKGTYKLEFMKQKVNTILRKGLDQFLGRSIGSKGWYKLDIEFFTIFSKSRSKLYKSLFKNNI